MPIVKNAPKGRCTFRTTSNTTFNVADLGYSTNNYIEAVTGASITKILTSGGASISRGGNLIFQTNLPIDLQEVAFTDFSSNNIQITVNSGSTVLVEFNKTSTFQYSTGQIPYWNLSKKLLSGIDLIFGRL
jgi:hypothetical protein